MGLPVTIKIENSAVDGSPACLLTTNAAVTYVYSGNNASSDASCGFSGIGSLQNVSLGLGPLVAEGASLAHLPGPTSVLRDAADPSVCLEVRDQTGSVRPQDSDADLTPVCEIGAIEVPEPVGLVPFAAGVLGLLALRRARCRTCASAESRP